MAYHEGRPEAPSSSCEAAADERPVGHEQHPPRKAGRWWGWPVAIATLVLTAILVVPSAASAYYVEHAGRNMERLSATSLERAEQALRRALDWDERNAQAQRLLAELAELQEDGKAAAAAWARFGELRPSSPLGHWRLALACEQLAVADLTRVTGHPCGADESGRRATLLHLWREAGQSRVGFVRVGDELSEKKDWPAATGYYNRALLCDPASAHAWQGLAKAATARGQLEAALEAFGQVVAHSSDATLVAAVRDAQGTLLAGVGRWTEAASELSAAVGLMPERGDYQLNYGWYLLRAAGQLGEADAAAAKRQSREALTAAAGLLPDDPWPRIHLSNLDFSERDYPAALASARQAIRLQPGLFWGWLWEGKALAEQERFAEAEESLRRAVELAPDKSAPHADLGRLLGQQGRLDEAIREYERAVMIAPADPWNNLSLADAYRIIGNLPSAIAAYRRVLELDPDNTTAQQALAELGR